MNFPKYWAKGVHGEFACWRWSDSSVAEATELAREAVRRLAERFASGERLERGYGYADRPLREPVLRELRTPEGDPAAVITRNSYGCLVLNTSRVMFVDVDLPEPESPASTWLKSLFGKPRPPQGNAAEDKVVALAEGWVRQHPGWGWRIYRTRMGLRLLATHDLFEGDGPSTEVVFEALGADPLYRRLCKAQRSFRARLTPKPWRCRVGKPPAQWPWPDAAAEARFKAWDQRYLEACRDRATCELVGTAGNGQLHPTVELIRRIHDDSTRVGSGLPLA